VNHVGKFATTLGAAAALLVLAVPVFAQNGGADGMPADQSTPAERAQTRALNTAISDANRAADAKAAAQRQQYETQRARYSEQEARYRDAMERHARQQDAYAARRNAYGLQRARYNTALLHQRHDWPDNDKWLVVEAASHPVGLAVQSLDGAHVGAISEVARGPGGHAEAFLLQLDGGNKAWIEGTALRFDVISKVLVTDLNADDFRLIADHGAEVAFP
jgi:hypothetical protein